MPQDFDLLAHLEVKEPTEEAEDDADDDDDADADEVFVQKFRKVTPNIQDFWIKLVPDKDSFIQIIHKTFQEGLQAIKCFERWNKHGDLVDYY